MKVSVLIDLDKSKTIGGHIKTWLQFSKVATSFSEQELQLTIHFLGDHFQENAIASNVRFVSHPPRFSSARLPFLKDAPSHTDLAPTNRALYPYLASADLIHVTQPLFTFGQTALRFCQTVNKPLVCSLHTDAPLYAKLYLQEKLEKIFGQGRISQWLNDQWELPERYRRSMEKKQDLFWRHCQHVWVGQPSEMERLQAILPSDKISFLRRGLDMETFDPAKADRAKLEKLYKIPRDRFLALFVGRLDGCKQVMTFAKAIKLLLDQKMPIHAVLVGQGQAQPEIESMLGQNVSCLGRQNHEALSHIYASADTFVFPSETEIVGNVVLEARSSGLPVVVSDQGGSSQHIQREGEDGLIVAGQDAQSWAEKIKWLYEQPQQRRNIGHKAYQLSQHSAPSWESVFFEDLFPIWNKLGQHP